MVWGKSLIQKRIGMGLVGPGFIAPHHIDAVRRLGNIDVIGIADENLDSARRKAEQLQAPRFYGSYKELLANPEVDVIHNTTPNFLHFEVSLAAIEAGKHIISEKPLARTVSECKHLCEAAKQAGVVNAVTFNYRGNPQVQQARAIVAQQEIGTVFFIHGQYIQDWLADPNVYSWRLDPAKGGASSALADIGSHWCDLAQHISGSRIVSVLAEMTTVISTRYVAHGSQEAFSKGQTESRTPVSVTGEDLASVLLRFENGAKGCLSVGQVMQGHKNGLMIEVDGLAGSLRWRQEQQNELWIGHNDRPNEILTKDAMQFAPSVRPYVHLPAGHQEGWSDAFSNTISDIYHFIRTGEQRPTVCTFEDGLQICSLIESMLKTHQSGGVWTNVNRT